MVSVASLHHIRLFYAAYFAAMGLILPYFPVYLSDRGLDVSAIGVMTGLLAAAKVIAPPWTGHVLDQRSHEQSRHFIVLASFVAAGFAVCMAAADNPYLLAAVIFTFGVLWAAILPLTDGLSVSVSEAALADYGRLRVWGSVGFVVASLAGGAWLAGDAVRQLPYWLAGLLLLTALAAYGFPEHREEEVRPDGVVSGFGAAFFALLAASFVMQVSHGAYYGFYSLYLVEIGFSGWQIGAFWVLGVVAEIVLMWKWARPLQQASPARVLGGCLLLAAIRWFGIGWFVSWLPLLLLQLLHAASFAAFHLSAVTWVKRLAPVGRHAAAQGWYSASGFGLGSAVGIMGCGMIAEYSGYAAAFYVCAGVALLGMLLVRRLPTGS